MSISPFLLETSLKIIKVNCIFFCSPDQKGHVRYCHCVCSVIINVIGKLVWDVHLIILYCMFSLLNRKRKILHWVMRVCPFNWFYFYLYMTAKILPSYYVMALSSSKSASCKFDMSYLLLSQKMSANWKGKILMTGNLFGLFRKPRFSVKIEWFLYYC